MLKKFMAMSTVFIGLLLAMVIQPVAANAAITERCSDWVVGNGGKYRTCIFASVDVVRARTVIVTTRCPSLCLYPSGSRLYVELYAKSVRVNADAITYPLGQGGTYQVVAYYKNDRGSNDRYWSVGRGSWGARVQSQSVIV